MIKISQPPYSYIQTAIKAGEIKKLDYMMKELNIIPNMKSFYCVPIIDYHFEKCVRYYQISSAYFFNAFHNKSLIFKMIEAKFLHQNEEVEKGISILMDAFNKCTSI